MALKRKAYSLLFLAACQMGTDASAEIDLSLYMTRPPKQIEKRNAVLATLTPSNIADGVKLEDDGMEAFAKMSTLNTFAFKAGWADRVEADNFFRAFIDRKTGKATYQLYQTIIYTDEYRIYDAANVLMPSGLVTKDLRKLGSEIIYCGAGLTCRREETIAIDLDDDEMQMLQRSTQWRLFAFASNRTPAWIGTTIFCRSRHKVCCWRSIVGGQSGA
jgi:hypothetical protein